MSDEEPLSFHPKQMHANCVSGGSSTSVHSNHTNLLETLREKQRDQSYRDIKFEVADLDVRDRFRKRISFDTIDIAVADPDIEDELDEYRMDFRGRSKSPIASPINRSPVSSPALKIESYLGEYLGNNYSYSSNYNSGLSGLLRAPRTDYPTQKIITHRGCTFTRVHPDFEALYRGSVPGRKPVLPGRSILVYLSGRKHTWVALDYIVTRVLEDGDRIVVVSAIDVPMRPHRRNSNFSPSQMVAKTPRMRLRQRCRPEFVKYVARDIMQYIMRLIDPNVIAKVSIELALGKTKDVLKDMYKLYEPNLVCAGTKPNMRISAPLQSWLSSKLTDRLVKNFPLPVIVVPAVNMGDFERSLKCRIEGGCPSGYFECTSIEGIQTSIDKEEDKKDIEVKNKEVEEKDINDDNKEKDMNECKNNKVEDIEDKNKEVKDMNEDKNNKVEDINEDNKEEHRAKESKKKSDGMENINQEGGQPSDSDTDSIDSDSSVSSGSTASSYSSYQEIGKLYCSFKSDVHESLRALAENPIDEDYFANFVKTVTDKSNELCREFKSMDPDARGDGAKLARAITGSNYFGMSTYQTKSLLDPVEKPERPAVQLPSISYKELKRNLKNNAQKPAIQVQTPSGSVSPVSGNPRKSALKFVGLEKPEAKPEKKNEKRSLRKSLKKSLSYDDCTHIRPPLEPLKSHPDLKAAVTDADKDEKKKKSRVRKLWKW